MFEPFQDLIKTAVESPWMFAPGAAVLVFAGILHFWLRRPEDASRRHALLFGIGASALAANIVFALYVWSFVRLLVARAWSFDGVWTAGAIGAGALTVCLWFGFYQILRQK